MLPGDDPNALGERGGDGRAEAVTVAEDVGEVDDGRAVDEGESLDGLAVDGEPGREVARGGVERGQRRVRGVDEGDSRVVEERCHKGGGRGGMAGGDGVEDEGRGVAAIGERYGKADGPGGYAAEVEAVGQRDEYGWDGRSVAGDRVF